MSTQVEARSRSVSVEGFYIGINDNNRVAVPLGVHEGTVVYHVYEGEGNPPVAQFQSCTEEKFFERYK
jgi:hypothetical protein